MENMKLKKKKSWKTQIRIQFFFFFEQANILVFFIRRKTKKKRKVTVVNLKPQQSRK